MLPICHEIGSDRHWDYPNREKHLCREAFEHSEHFLSFRFVIHFVEVGRVEHGLTLHVSSGEVLTHDELGVVVTGCVATAYGSCLLPHHL